MTERWHTTPPSTPSVAWQADVFGAGLAPDQFVLVLGRIGTGKESPVDVDGAQARPAKAARGGVVEKKMRDDD